MLNSFLRIGYFPRELPTPFHTESFANALQATPPDSKPYSLGNKVPNYSSKCAVFNLARRGTLRRVLSVPNPINYYHLAKSISENWAFLNSHYIKADNSISRPVVDSIRALGWEKGFEYLSEAKLKTRSASRYLLRADISNFYPSIYTHSIPWALHTKPVAKNDFRFSANIGNKIDTHVRNCQEKQTKGIPIGPDPSFAISEIILASIDEFLNSRGINKFHRYIDDYEFGLRTYQEAENTLMTLQEALDTFELTLNSSKTKILEAPFALDPIWVHELRKFEIRNTPFLQRIDLLHYFDLVMNLLEQNPNEAIVSFAIKKTSAKQIYKSNIGMYQSILLQWAIVEPGILPIALDFIHYYRSRGAETSDVELQNTLSYIIELHSIRGHTSEICYALFGHILFNLPIDGSNAKRIESMENPFVALLALDAKSKGLVPDEVNFEYWHSLIKREELTTENWILAYEACIKNWFPDIDNSFIDQSPGFRYLKDNQVSFYNDNWNRDYEAKTKYKSFDKITLEQQDYFDDTELEEEIDF